MNTKGELFTFTVAYDCFNINELDSELKLWLGKISVHYKSRVKDLRYVFCDDDYLLALNKDYLNHNTYTDILTFQYNKEGSDIDGEIYISVDRVRDNAMMYENSFNAEVLRVMAHGFLHLIGYRDKDNDDREEMRREEECCIGFATDLLKTSQLLTDVPRGT